ncbi:leukocyte receptor cluster member 9-like isoform X1 [Osmerus mordax]|uniref:leukocyte receptor cluster member 9-like isoform X1 n=1 Tax=Osmerus mordax TaxID=8014 RepID=UPI0035104FBC
MATDRPVAPGENQVKDGLIQELATEWRPQEKEGAGVCQFFLKGKCRFGPKCRKSHSPTHLHTPPSNPELTGPESGQTALDSWTEGEKEGNHKKSGRNTKTHKTKYTEEKGSSKKPRMRTADEVIARILWDSTLEEVDFVVGYVDRFLGVLERPFSEFNWDADPCDCDYTTELALPQHRIQYFTHRGRRVWDRNTRTDRVFGSTGNPVAPPFGGEEEVTGKKEQKAIPLEEEEEGEEEEEEGEEEETGCLAEREQHETNVLSSESVKQGLPDHPESGSSPRGQQEAGRESKPLEEEDVNKAADSGLVISTDRVSLSEREGATEKEEDPNKEEWKETWEGDKQEGPAPDGLQPVPLEQREERSGRRPPKRKPTHFITFRANTPSILSSFQRLQEELVALLPSSTPYWVPPSSLHVTLCLLVLPGPAEVTAAVDILRRFAHLDRNPPVALTFPLKLKHFNGRVLYLSPQPQLLLQQLNSGLQEAYMERGWLHRDSYSPRYHLTLAKVNWQERERLFEGAGDLRAGKGLSFGRLPVNRLHLCGMGMTEDGFYDTVCTVTLR